MDFCHFRNYDKGEFVVQNFQVIFQDFTVKISYVFPFFFTSVVSGIPLVVNYKSWLFQTPSKLSRHSSAHDTIQIICKCHGLVEDNVFLGSLVYHISKGPISSHAMPELIVRQ